MPPLRQGTWYVEPVELHRVFPPAQSEANVAHQYAQEDAGLRIRLSLAEERVCELKQEVVRWREQADAWREQAQASQKQLTGQAQARARIADLVRAAAQSRVTS
jgi:hypothetical protein